MREIIQNNTVKYSVLFAPYFVANLTNFSTFIKWENKIEIETWLIPKKSCITGFGMSGIIYLTNF